MNIIRLIKKNVLFQDFEDKEVNKLFDSLQGKIVKYGRGKLVIQSGAKTEDIGILLKGVLLKFVVKSDGSKEPQGTIEAGGMFAEVDGFAHDGIMSYSVLSAEDSTVLYISRDSIVGQSATSEYNRKLMINVLKYLALKITAINKDTEYLVIKSMRLKISKLIYDAYKAQNSLNVELKMNRNEMAEYLNVSRPSMSREMMRMRDENIITFWKDKISIKDLRALEDIVKKH